MPPTVLLVDDDYSLVDVVSAALRRHGYATRVAHDGPRALQILHAEPIDLIILDMIMPEMDGLEVCRRIRSDPQIAHLPILLFTALTLRAELRDGRHAGADDYIVKPVVIREVIGRVQALLARSAEQAAAGTVPRQALGPLVAFVGAKGGVGTSTVALNVALGLVAHRLKTLLLDLGGPGLTAAWTLGLEPSRMLFDVARTRGVNLTAVDLQGATLAHASGLRYLPGYTEALPISNACQRAVVRAFEILRGLYDLILIDLDGGQVGTWQELLRSLVTIIPVAENDPLCLRHLRALLERLKGLGFDGLVPGLVLVERTVNPAREPAAAVAERVGLPLLALIPPAAEALYRAHTEHVPLALAEPACPAAQALAALAVRVMGKRN